MDSNQILTITVFVIVITIVGTIALAVVGYLAFRLRERKHPSRPGIERHPGTPYFFERIGLPQAGDDADQVDGDTAVKGLPGGEPAEGGAGTDDEQSDDPAPAAEGERTAEESAAPTGSGDPDQVDPGDGPPRD